MLSIFSERRVTPVVAATVGMLLIFATISAPAVALASNGKADPRSATDPKNDVNELDLPDFDIMSFGFSDSTPYIQVYGLAGRTIEIEHEPHEGEAEKVLAYVIDTNSGAWAIDFHSFDHDHDEANQN